MYGLYHTHGTIPIYTLENHSTTITHIHTHTHTHTHFPFSALGYSTKIYFNACCKPSPLFDVNKVASSLPFSFEAGYFAETTQKVLQLFVDLSKDPLTALQRFPEGDGPVITAKSLTGEVFTRKCQVPKKLSDYWINMYKYAELFECCENFLSASIPSVPCLLCHPFGKSNLSMCRISS